MIDRIRHQLFKETYKKGIDPKDLFLVKRSGGDFTSEGKALFEVFGPTSEDPYWLVKACRSKAGNQKLAAEFERQKNLRKNLPEDLRGSLSSPLVFEDQPSGSISIETYLTGTKVSSYFLQGSSERIWKNWQSYGKAALRWLERYSEVVSTRELRLDSDWFAKEILLPLERNRAVWVSLVPEAEEAIEIFANTQIDFALNLKRVPQHGDYTPGNLIAMEDRLGVIDWSPVDSGDPPLMDLFHFLLSASIYLMHGLNGSDSPLSLPELHAEARFAEKIRPEVRALFLQAGIPAEARIPLLRAACWKKIEGFLLKPQIVESSLKDWTNLLQKENLARFETLIESL